MGASLLITLREGMEAALIIGIVLGMLARLEQKGFQRHVWAGTVSASILSLLAGGILYALGIAFEGRGEEIFEGATTLTAATLLTWMIFWMRSHGRELAKKLEADTQEAVSVGGKALFAVAFFAVLREGLETALFLTAAAFQVSGVDLLVGGLIGLGLAILLGLLVFRASLHINLHTFFNLTGLLLLLVAAGLVAHGIHEFQEAGLLPVMIEPIWDTNSLLSEKSTLGSFLKALFGYNGDPSLLEVTMYFLYLAVVGLAGRSGALQRLRYPSASSS